MRRNGFNSTKNLVLFFVVTLFWTWLAGFAPSWLGLTGTPLGTFIFYFGGGAPSVVGLFMVLRTYPKEARHDYFRRCFSPRNAGMRGFIWPILFFACISLISVGVSVGVLGYTMPEMEWIHAAISNPLLIPLMLLLSLVSGPLNEEFGWRGYSLDRMFVRIGFVPASLVLGFIWTAWHLPWFFTPGQAQYQMLQSSIGEALVYIVFNTLLSVAVSYVYIITKRSILAAAFTHMMSNFLTSQLLVPFSSQVRTVIFVVTSVFCAIVLLYTVLSKAFKKQYGEQRDQILADIEKYG